MLDHGEPIDVHGWESVYLICLSLTIEGFALLAFGLVRPWGERAPRCFRDRRPPRASAPRGRRRGDRDRARHLHRADVLRPGDSISDLEATDAGRAMAVACYLPLLLWGPLLGALTIAYHRRRCRD